MHLYQIFKRNVLFISGLCVLITGSCNTHALCRSCEVQQETSELAQHGGPHGDMAELSPPSSCSLASFSSSCWWRSECGLGIQDWGCAGEENKLRPGQGKGGEWGAGISHVCLHPSACPGQTFPEYSWLALQFPIPCWEGALSEACVWKDDPPLPLPFSYCFSPYEKERSKMESQKAKKEAVTRLIPQASIIGGGWGGEAWSQDGCSKVPSCLLKCWEVSVSIQILLMWWERTISQASSWIICTPNTASHVVFPLAFSNLTSTTHVFNCILLMAI